MQHHPSYEGVLKIAGLIALFVGVMTSASAAAQETPPAPTRASCDSQYNGCFVEAGFFGFFTCTIQYGQCISQAEDALPPEVRDTANKVAACRDAAETCRNDAAEDQEKLAACSQTQRQCTTDALGIETSVPEGTSECFSTLQTCVDGAQSQEALGQCRADLRSCLTPETTDSPAP